MNFKKPVVLFAFFFFVVSYHTSMACSMYKVTANGKTMIGCNHDAWLTSSKIWFENGSQPEDYGAAFTGARAVGKGRTTPQSGMNTRGLVFSRLASYHPAQNNPFTDKLKIKDEADYLSSILHACATVAEVKQYILQYDRSIFLNDVFIYIDSVGDYLVVEPFTFIEGTDSTYVLANFCPSITSLEQARKLDRYRRGEDFLATTPLKTTLEFCTALSDTMHVCRKRNGDGTLLTSIWDSKDGLVTLYFYHDYDTAVHFSLTEELAKGDHVLAVPDLFPSNAEFEQLASYKTPSNTVWLRVILVGIAALLVVCSAAFFVMLVWGKSRPTITPALIAAAAVINVLLVGYVAVLITNKGIFYFDLPYQHPSAFITGLSYMPVVLLLFSVLFAFYGVKQLKTGVASWWAKVVFVLNNAVYVLLVLGFAYWGLYAIW